MKVTEKEEIAGRGHQKLCAEEVHMVYSGTMTTNKGKEKGEEQWTPGPTQGRQTPSFEHGK